MKYLFYSIMLVGLLNPIFVSGQFLHADGKIIVDGDGNEVILRGMGLGGWMLQEGYMLQLSSVANPQHEIRALIENTIGVDNTNTFYDAWLKNHCRKIDVDSLASWGFNSIRLPMHYNLFTLPVEDEPVAGQNTWLDKGFAMTDSLLNWCAANHIYLILDLHAAPGGQGHDAAISDYDDSKPSLWESDANKQKTIALWRKLAARYSNNPWIGGYDLLNETNWGFENPNDLHGNSEQGNVPLRELLINITNAIREVDSNHIIFIEGNSWANNYNGIFPPWDSNMVASFHKYWTVNDVESIQWMLAFQQQYNLPLWLGESGENSNTWYKDAISICERNHIGWSWWPLKKVGLNCILEIKKTQGYQNLVDYWQGNASQPSASEAFATMMELAENSKLENCFYHPGIVDAMMRQPHDSRAVPFKKHTISNNDTLFVVDYDLGGNEVGYFDNVIADYHVSTGSYTAWNTGWVYRNDGVDIDVCQDTATNGFALGWTEPGEWLQYTVEVPQEGAYDISIRAASAADQNKMSLYVNDLPATVPIDLPNTGGWQLWETTIVKDIYLAQGTNTLRLVIEGGEYNLNYMAFNGPKPMAAVQPTLTAAALNPKNYTQIFLAYNQPFQPLHNTAGFSALVNGVDYVVDSVFLATGQDQLIVVQLQTPLAFGDQAQISYTGNTVKTISDVLLDTFADVPITIDIPNPMDANLIPGRIESENMTENHGFRTDIANDEGGGLYTGWSDSTDYMIYDVEVLETGTYQVTYRHAGQGGSGKINLYELTGSTEQLLQTVTFNSTLGWQNWRSTPGAEISLSKGSTRLKLEVVNANFNLNFLDVKLLSVPPSSDFNFIRGYTNTDGDTLELQMNKEVSAASLATKGFNMTVDGQNASMGTIGLKDAKTMVFKLPQSLSDAAVIKISYDSTGTISDVDGKSLMPFSNELVKNQVVILNLIDIPGKVEAEAFSVNNGFEFEDCSDTGGGKNAGYTDAGDYLDFDVNVSEAGKYRVSYRVASESAGGDLSLLQVKNGKTTLLSRVSFNATGGWQNWTTVTDDVTLEAGPQVIRLQANASLFNINWVSFQKISDQVTGLDHQVTSHWMYPNPSKNYFYLWNRSNKPLRDIQIHSIAGKTFKFARAENDGKGMIISHNLPTGLYLVSWRNGERHEVQKLVVIR